MSERVRIINKTRGVELAGDALVADTFRERLVGLMRRDGLPEGEGLVIRPCNSVHTFFMRFAIDVIFLSEEGTVVDMWCHMPPNRATWLVSEAKEVVELPAGTVLRSRTMPGHQLVVK